jgi:LPS-assembly protein
MTADSQQRVGDTYRLIGSVEITYGTTQMTADEAQYDASTGLVSAAGNIRFAEPLQNAEIRGSRLEYNLRDGTGSFYDAEGSVGGLVRSAAGLLTSTNPFYFTAERIDRVGPDTYRVHNAEVTVCRPDSPTWTFRTPLTTIYTGESVHIQHAQLRLWRVPVFYLPYVYRSLRHLPRNSGFLMPTIGNNSRLGVVLGDSFFWAISRSMDAEIGGEYFSKRGWSQRAGFRVVPTSSSYLKVSYYGVVDRGIGAEQVDQGGRTIAGEGAAALPGGFRGVLNFDYLSSLTFREAFAQTYSEAVSSEVHALGFLTRTGDSFAFNTRFSQIESFQSLEPGDTVRLRFLPSLEFDSVERPLWRRSPLRISWESRIGWVSRREPLTAVGSNLRSGLMERIEFQPRLSLPLRWKWFRFTPAVSYSAAHYGKQLLAGRVVDEGWNRGATTATMRWDLPTLVKLYSGAGPLYRSSFQHAIEPRVIFRHTNGVGDFSRALLFDERDLMVNSTELEYSLTQRLLVKREGSPGVQEALSWELKQQYYFDPRFGEALVAGRRNIFLSSLALSGAVFLDQPRRFSPVISVLRFRPSYRYDVEFHTDYDPDRHRLTHGGLVGTVHWKDAFASMSHFFVRSSRVLASPSNQLGFTVGYGSSARRGWSGAFAGSYDVREKFLQFTALQAGYNNDCCGISFEYRRFALGPARTENQFRVAFSLANVGTFGTLKRQERLF